MLSSYAFRYGSEVQARIDGGRRGLAMFQDGDPVAREVKIRKDKKRFKAMTGYPQSRILGRALLDLWQLHS